MLDSLTCPVVLIEPFVLPVKHGQDTWGEDLDPKLDVVRKLAVEYGAILVPAYLELNRQAANVGAATLADDGVHPTAAGHRALADLWRTFVLEH
jgi:lysophospholipase L1-like esterase